ncbi:MAG: nucleotide exchange factor GrpE, partial [Candidatus Liptonbacteria bacterium]
MSDEIKNQVSPENDGAAPQNANESQAPIEKCARECEEYLKGWQRTKADFINYKKEEAKRLEEFTKYNLEGFLKEFILILDNFDLAIAAHEKMAPQNKGIFMIRTQIEAMLKSRGV